MAEVEESTLQMNMMMRGENLINPELLQFETMDFATPEDSTSNARKRKRKLAREEAACAEQEEEGGERRRRKLLRLR